MSKQNNIRVSGAAFIVTTAIVLSKITGFFRSALIPNMIPDKSHTDAMYLSFTLTDFMFNLLIGGAVSSALIPVLSGYISKKKEKEGWVAIGTYMNVTFIVILIFSILGVIFTPQIINLAASNFSEEQKLLTIKLTRILFPSVAFIMFAGITNGVLYSYKKFAAAAYGSSIYNIASVTSILFLSRFGVEMVVTGIMVSAIIFFVFQFSFAYKYFVKFYKFKLFLKDKGFQRVVKLALPSLASSSVVQLNVFISAFFTGMLATGSLTAYRNANDTWQLPYGIFAMGLGFAVLPSLSEKAALGKMEVFRSMVTKALKIVLLLNIPSAIAFIVIKNPIISVIYKWSNNINIEYTGSILMFFTISLLSYSILAIVTRSFYALNDTLTPLFTGSFTIFINLSLCFLLLKFTDLDAAGMALAYSSAGIINALTLLIILNKKVGGINLPRIGIAVLKILFASSAMAITLYIVNFLLPIDYTNTQFTKLQKIKEIAGIAVLIVSGGTVYIFIILKLKLSEATYVKNMLLSKLKPISNLSNKIFRN